MNPIKHVRKYLQNKQLNIRRENAVIQGDFVYFIIEDGTNIRTLTEDGKVVMYYSKQLAETECNWEEIVVSVSEYNRMFGSLWTW